jgi:predicted Ser/Thr protein kinase
MALTYLTILKAEYVAQKIARRDSDNRSLASEADKNGHCILA